MPLGQALGTLFPDITWIESFSRHLEEGNSCRETLDHFIEEIESISSIQRRRINLFLELFDITNDEFSAIVAIFNDASITTLSEVAIRAFPQFDNSTDRLRMHIFEKEPTAVILGLLQKKDSPFLSILQPSSIEFLEELYSSDDFNILTDPIILRLGGQSQYTDTEQLLDGQKMRLMSLQAISVVVKNPEDIAILLKAGFVSANSIASITLDSFVQQIGSTGDLIEPAEDIHSHAHFIKSRTEHLLPQINRLSESDEYLIQAQNYGGAAAFASVSGAAAEELKMAEEQEDVIQVDEAQDSFLPMSQETSKNNVKNLREKTAPIRRRRVEPTNKLKKTRPAAAAILMDAEEPDDPDSLSVLSPAAYLVDLFQMLKGAPVQPKKDVASDKAAVATESGFERESKVGKDTEKEITRISPNETLFDRLVQRRPDLLELELSRRNTEVSIPYIDLANEVMESFISYIEDDSTPVSIQKHNMDEVDSNETNIAEPRHVDVSIYEQYIQREVFPLQHFPWNLSLESIRADLVALGSTRSTLQDAMHSIPRMTSPLNIEASEAEEIIARMAAAERLHLSDGDFLAIAKLNFLGVPTTVRSVPEYWGYEPGDEGMRNMLDTDEVGLSCIKKQLLPKFGLSFVELVEIMRTKFLNQRLVITPHISPEETTEKEPQLADSLEEYRLYSLDTSTSSNQLKLDDCDRLNRFIRLYQRMKWPLSDLDDALLTLQNCLGGGSEKDDTNITSDVIVNLDAIRQISLVAKLPLYLLLPLWTSWDNGSSPLLARVFDRPLLKTWDSDFAKGLKEGNWAKDETLSAHVPVILNILGLSLENFLVIVKTAKLPDRLNRRTLTFLYQATLRCNLLKCTAKEYLELTNFEDLGFQQGFETPLDTYRTVVRWRGLIDREGWSAERFLSIIKPIELLENDTALSQFLRKAKSKFEEQSKVSSLVRGGKQPGATELASINTEKDRCLIEVLQAETQIIDEELLHFLPRSTLKKSALEVLRAAMDLIELQTDTSIDAHHDNFKEAATIYTYIQKLARTFTGLGMELDEIKYHVASPIIQGAGTTLSVLFVEEVINYSALRKGLSDTPKQKKVFEFFQIVNAAEKSEDIVAALHAITGWTVDEVNALLMANYPGADLLESRDHFLNSRELLVLFEQVKYSKLINIDVRSTELLFQCAGYPPVDTDQSLGQLSDPSSSTARQLRDIIRVKAMESKKTQETLNKSNDILRLSRRDVLIHYLLRHPFILKCNIQDADGLFEYFLIDVQMGSALQTSRIKQAISTVQLFIYRCLLNEEKGIKSERIVKDRWAWTQKYNLWEANRKVFLYAENWVDPTLRDNKSEQFKVLESSMLQKELSRESILDHIKTYIYSIDALAHLDIQAYYIETLSKSESRFHFFGRTKNSPHEYYYRTMDYFMSKGIPIPRWEAWRKIELEIPSYEVDELGGALKRSGSYLIPFIWNKQIHLFMPQLVLKTRGDDELLKTTSKSPLGVTPPPPPTLPAATPTVDASTSMETKPAAVRRYWELKMAWSVLRDGKWSSTRTSQSPLKVNEDDGTLPKISQLRFLIWHGKSRENHANANAPSTLRVLVERTKSTTEVVTIGEFLMSGPELITRELEASVSKDRSIQETNFGKLIGDGEDWTTDKVAKLATTLKAASGESTKVMLAVPPSLTALNSTKNATWTLSFSGSHGVPSGLVVDVSGQEGSQSQSWFAIPEETTIVGGATGCVRLYNVLSSKMMQDATTAQSIQELYAGLSDFVTYAQTEDKNSTTNLLISDVFGKHNTAIFRETSTANAIYTWELGFHVISLFVERLLSNGQCELALEVARLVFDPTVLADTDAIADEDKQKGFFEQMWQFFPFKDREAWHNGSVNRVLKNLEKSSGTEEEVLISTRDWRKNPFLAHSVARNRPLVYMKRFAIKYVEILIQAGDALFRQDSMESIPLAIQRYVEASHVFGSAPQRIPTVGTRSSKTFRELSDELDDFSNASTSLELNFPFYVPMQERGIAAKSAGSVLGFVATKYFSVPVNPEIAVLREKLDIRFHRIRNGMDINGRPRKLSLWDPPLDMNALIKDVASGTSPDQIAAQVDEVLPNYRFVYLMQKALELCSELKNMGASYLLAKEKRDTETMMLKRIQQEKTVNELTLSMKKLQLEESEKALQHLEQTRLNPTMRLKYYAALTGDDVKELTANDEFQEIEQTILPPSKDNLRMSFAEVLELSSATRGGGFSIEASKQEALAGEKWWIPSASLNAQPWGIGCSVSSPNAAGYWLSTASEFKSKATVAMEESLLYGRINRLNTQLQERRLQANMAGLEIKSVDKQIEIQNHRIKMVKQDIEAHKTQSAMTEDNIAFMKTKHTNAELYSWMETSMRKSFYDTYIMTLTLAKKVHRAFEFDTGRNDITMAAHRWDTAHDGLLCAENLYLSLKQLEMAYMEKRYHDYEIVKSCSLRQLAPWALLHLRAKGEATFSIPEVLFDLDFPGHLKRRLKSVSVSMPCVAGPYTSLNLTLTLNGHSCRVTEEDITNYSKKGVVNSQYPSNGIPIDSIAVSSGQQDSGVFDLNFHNERYMPFEGAGAISDWKLQLPMPHKQFDYETIADVIIHLRYTSVQGSPELKEAAALSTKQFLERVSDQSHEKGLFGLLDVKNDYPLEWHGFKSMQSADGARIIILKNIKERLPFFTKVCEIEIISLCLLLKGPGGEIKDITASLNIDLPLSISKNASVSGFTCLGLDDVVTATKPGVKNDKLTMEQKAAAALKATSARAVLGKSDWTIRFDGSRENLEGLKQVLVLFSYRVTGS